MTSFDFRPRTRVLFGEKEFARLGEIARELGSTRCLVVSDPGIDQIGYTKEAMRALKARRMDVTSFTGFTPHPNSDMVAAGVETARDFSSNGSHPIDLIVAVGGGSSMDCAKAINLVLTNGGSIQEFWGYGKATRPMLPMIAVPTTAGTGSEAQSYATITDVATGTRMACGDHKCGFLVAILDPKLTMSQPVEIANGTGFDALSHAIESLVTIRRSPMSECFAMSAWRLTQQGLERMLEDPENMDARARLLLGAHFGGMAIENSMLGAAHALAFAMTAEFPVSHAAAIAVVLPHVVEWNDPVAGHRYRELYDGNLPERLRELAEKAGLPGTLREAGIPQEAITRLAENAASQWAGRFNPRPFSEASAVEILEKAL